jgi:hypothetical protein
MPRTEKAEQGSEPLSMRLSILSLQITSDWKARPLLHPRYGGKLGEGGLEVFDDVQLRN